MQAVLHLNCFLRPCKQKTVLLEEWFSTKTPKWDSQHFQSPLFLIFYINSLIKGEITPFLLSCTFIFHHILYCAFFIVSMLVGIDKKQNQFGKFLVWFLSWHNPQNFIKIWPKTVLFRNIALIFSLENPYYLEISNMISLVKWYSNFSGYSRMKI